MLFPAGPWLVPGSFQVSSLPPSFVGRFDDNNHVFESRDEEGAAQLSAALVVLEVELLELQTLLGGTHGSQDGDARPGGGDTVDT